MTAEHDAARPLSDSAGSVPGQEAGGSAAADGAFTALLRSDAVMLLAARAAMEEHGGGPGGALAARRVLDEELRAAGGWPRGAQYLAAAAGYERAGRPEDASLLRQVAGTDQAIAEARTAWNLRYSGRPATPGDELTASMREAGVIEFDPAGPYLGIDGAAYEPGVLRIGDAAEPVLVIGGRGGSELLSGWPDYAAMAAWLATRGTTASGPLTPPPGHRDCRAWQEDLVLARLIGNPADAPRLTAAVPPATFTTDVRYEVFQAIAGASGRSWPASEVAAGLARQMTGVPAHGLARYGGASAPLARAYLNRLTETLVNRDVATTAATDLVQEDKRYRARAQAAAPARTAARPGAPGAAPAPGPGLTADCRRPGPLPAGNGVIPRP